MNGSNLDRIAEERSHHWSDLVTKHFPESDDLLTVVIKGHLLIEQHLTTIISHYCHSPEFLVQAKLTFNQKALLSKSIILYAFPPDFWEFIFLLNSLRNDFSHELEPKKLESHLAAIREFCVSFNEHANNRALKDAETDSLRLKVLIGTSLGLLRAVDSIVLHKENLRGSSLFKPTEPSVRFAKSK